jgi:twinkle protein
MAKQKTSVCVERLPHSCGSLDGLQVFQQEDGDYDGYCFGCKTYVAHPYEKLPNHQPQIKRRSDEDIAKEIADISSLSALDLTHIRGLRRDSLEYFNIRCGVSGLDGKSVESVYFPYTANGELAAYKIRLLTEKRMWSVGKMKDVDLFGWEQAKQSGAKRLYITEGEFDTAALFQMLRDAVVGTKWEHLVPAVCSLPNGASSVAKTITRMSHAIRQLFPEVVFVPDVDKAGAEAADVFARLYPGVFIAELPMKDANACLMEGMASECTNAVRWRPSTPKNTRIVLGSSLREAAKKKPEIGRAWPWEGLTKATRGRRRGETYYFGAGVKMGKSEVVDSIAAHIVLADQLPVFLVKPEQDTARTYKNLVGKAAGRIFHDPNIEFDEEAYNQYEGLIGDKAIILDSYQFVNWDSLKDDIRYVVTNHGVEDIIIDPITCFTNQMSSAEANEFLTGMAAELASLAKDLRFTSYIFCHLKAPTSGLPHERGGSVMSTQFTGSRAMMRSCNYMIGIEGNKDPNLEKELRNIRHLVILEDREFGSSEKISLYWNHETGLFSEIAHD